MFQFPAAPTVGQIFTPIPGVSYQWNGKGWAPTISPYATTVQRFSGTGVAVNFTLAAAPGVEENTLVYVHGVYQQKDTYSVTGTTLAFSTAPPAGTDNIEVVVGIGGGLAGPTGPQGVPGTATATYVVQNFSGTGVAVSFTLSIDPGTEANVQVFIDGVYQQKNCFSVSGTTLTFDEAPPVGTSNVEVVIGANAANVPSDGSVTPAKLSFSPLNGNRIINGKLNVDLRKAGIGTIASGGAAYFRYVDRWYANVNSSGPTGQYTFGVEADSLYPNENRLKIECTVAQPGTLATATDFYAGPAQGIESYNIGDMKFGTPYALGFTYAFEVEANFTGLLCVAFRGGSPSQSWMATYNYPVANVRQQVVVVVPNGPTGGTWTLGSNNFTVVHGLAAGTSYQHPSPNTAWAVAFAVGVAGMKNVMDTVGNIIRYKNMRLYKGAVDLGDDGRTFQQELALCQRYFCKSYNYVYAPGAVSGHAPWGANAPSTGFPDIVVHFPVPMRATPTVILYNPVTGAQGTWRRSNAVLETAVSANSLGDQGFLVGITGTAATPGEFVYGQFTAESEI